MLKLLFRASTLQVMAFAVDLSASFWMMPFLLHHLGQVGYGAWAIIGTIIGQVTLLDFGLASTTQRFIANATGRGVKEEAVAIYSTALVIFSILGLFAMLVVLALAPLAASFYARPDQLREFQWALVISGFSLATRFPFSVLTGSLLAKLRNDAVVSCQITETLSRVVLIYFAVQKGYGLVGIASAGLLASFAGRFVLVPIKALVAPELVFRSSKVSWSRARELIHFGKYVFAIRIGDMLRYRLDNLIIAPFLGLAAVARYSVAARLSDYQQDFILRILAIPGPAYAAHAGRGEFAEIRSKYLLVSEIGAGLLGLTVAGTLLFGHRFITAWLGEGFDDSYYAFAILTSGMMFTLLQAPSRDVLGAIYRHPFDAKWNTVESAINIALTLLLIQKFGIIGAACGTAIPMIVIKGILMPRYVCQQIELRIGDYLASVLRPLLVSLAVALCGAWLLPFAQMKTVTSIFLWATIFLSFMCVAIFLSFSKKCRDALFSGMARGKGASVISPANPKPNDFSGSS